ncbi:glycosyltransferase [Paraglaciecola aquimarina]|uniref:Glycosyltransferase n=1 Tax=Paraglaciecola algarum TaxID=3050085 RepID=A0ABS9D413_9ALTE|nr:glycosyltransferase [Paraglaciecola sp. G1-23]MCF2947682.1 glycosyltransferase [Paraglaciecola sp. G1-23]
MSANIRVLHLLKTSVGASWALRQTQQLVKLGVEVHLVLPAGPMVDKYKAAGVNVHVFDPSLCISRPWKNIARIRKLRALVKEIDPDVIHSHFVATTLLMRFGLVGLDVPRIFHVPGPLHLEHKIFRWLDLTSGGKLDYWLASCLWTQKKYLSCGIAEQKVGLAYYGVNAGDFTFKPGQNDLKASLGMASSDFLIGMVAYFYAPKGYLGQTRGLKGHEDLIDAVGIVRKQFPKTKCVFVGGPWGATQGYFNQVKQYAENTVGDACVFLGTRQDVPELYPQFDLAVHPSHSENVGGAVESMYAGIPTLTTNIGGFPDLVTDGETGLLAEVKSPESLANKIMQAIEQPELCEKLVQQGTIKVQQVMNVEHNAKQVFEFYQQVLADYQGKTVSLC